MLVVSGTDLLSDGGCPLVFDLAELRAGVEGTLPSLF